MKTLDKSKVFVVRFSGVCVPRSARAHVCRAIASVAQSHGMTGVNLGIRFVDEAEMCKLHLRHLNDARPTDVLTFDLKDNADERAVDGEIAICVDVAFAQAEQRGHSTVAELTLYAVHGMLHLLGYDDKEPSDAKAMHTTEDSILASIGLGAVYASTPGKELPKRRPQTSGAKLRV